VESLEGRRLLTAGAADPSFASGGVASFANYTQSHKLLMAANGDLLAWTDQRILAINQQGALDTSFGSSGLLAPSFTLEDVLVAPNGDVVVIGDVNNNVEVARYTAAGVLDNTFGSGGIATIDAPTDYKANGSDCVVQANGNVVVGVSWLSTTLGVSETGWLDFVLTRLNAGGSIDTTYGRDGALHCGELAGPTTMALLPNQSVVLTARENPIGMEVNGGVFVAGPTGYRVYTVGSNSVTEQTIMDTQGRFLVAANPETFDYRYYINRYLEDGKADKAFADTYGGLGFRLEDYYDQNDIEHFEGMAATSDGGELIVYGGGASLTDSGQQDATYTFIRLNSTGSYDQSFGYGGIIPAPAPPDGFAATGDPVIASDGDFFLGGADVNGHLAVARFQGSDETASTPSVGSIHFVPPSVGKRWGYVTVTYDPGTAALNLNSLASSPVLVETGLVASDGGSELGAANLVADSGGNGSPVTATYVFAVSSRGLNRLNKGDYTFIVGADAVEDANSVASVGAVAVFDLYVPRLNHGAPVALPVLPSVVPMMASSVNADVSVLQDGQSLL
jgi:uncharacterized delta-60 repeat protein